MKFNVVVTIFLFSILMFFMCCKTDKKEETIYKSNKVAVIKTTDATYKLTGTIGQNEIEMYLMKHELKFNGVFFWKNNGDWISVDYDTVVGNELIFNEYDVDGKIVAKINLTWSDLEINGKRQDLATNSVENIKLTIQKGEGIVPLLYESITDSIPADDSKNNKNFAKFSSNFINVKDTMVVNYQWFYPQLSAIYNDGKPTEKNNSLEKIIENKQNAFFENYLKSVDAPKKSKKGQYKPGMNYVEFNDVVVYYNANNIVSLRIDNYHFNGGAHGFYSSYFYSFDLNNKNTINWEDILKVPKENVKPLVERKLKEKFHLNQTDSLSVVLLKNEVGVTNNLVINNKGLQLLYNPYEIASYANGQIRVFIPFSEIKDLLRPEFQELVGMTQNEE